MIKSISTVNVEGKCVILRAGFDVPLKKLKEKEVFAVADNTRIRDALKTINYLVKRKAKIVIISHLDRPNGQHMPEKSMWPVAEELGRLIKVKTVIIAGKFPQYQIPHIYFLSADITSRDFSGLAKKMKPGDVLFLENLRFYPGEEENSNLFVEALSRYGEIYVNEAFSVAHRMAASTYGLPLKLKSYAGISLGNELSSLDRLLKRPKQPFVVVMGGVKVSDKVDTINHLGIGAEKLLLGGAIGNGFIKAFGYEVGRSLAAEQHICSELLRNFRDKIVLPEDVVVARSEEDDARVVSLDKVKPYETIYDIGPKTVNRFTKEIRSAKTIVWNGPLGKIEVPKFSFGSKAVARAIAQVGKRKAFTVVGGGETAEVVSMAKAAEFIDHVSTGGGALLEYLAGKELPALKALSQSK
jgi:phosphoglycerate kinase